MLNTKLKTKLLIILIFISSFILIFYTIKCSEFILNIETERNNCYLAKSSKCILELNKKYKYISPYYKNFLKYDYACLLSQEGEFQKAIDELNTLLSLPDIDKNLLKNIELEKSKNIKLLNDINTKKTILNFYNPTLSARWKNPQNIKIYINTNDYSTKKAIKQAFSTWENSLDKIVKFHYLSSSKNADITVEFTNQIPNNKNHKAAETKLHYNIEKKIIYKAKILISLYSPYSQTKFNENQIYHYALHEIGHALGILNHSNAITDVMYPNDSYRKNKLSERDINTVKVIYKN